MRGKRSKLRKSLRTVAGSILGSVKRPGRSGNWSPDGSREKVSQRRDFKELTPAQRVEQVWELSRFMSQVAEAGRRLHARWTFAVAFALGRAAVDLGPKRMQPLAARTHIFEQRGQIGLHDRIAAQSLPLDRDPHRLGNLLRSL